MKKYLILIALFAGFTSFAHAQTTPYQTSTYSTPYTTYPTYTSYTPTYAAPQQFSIDLSVGSKGQDVVELQNWLISHGFDIPAITSGRTAPGTFGQQTKTALQAYQRSVGLQDTGFFGPATRERMRGVSVMGYPTYPTYPTYQAPGYSVPVINEVQGPTTLSVNQVGTWTIRATDTSNFSSNNFLTYTVDWGDNSPSGSSSSYLTSSYTQTATFTHTYANPGVYTVRFTVRNTSNLSAQTTLTVRVEGHLGAGPLRIVTPNGGEVWQRNTNQTIRWTSPNYLLPVYGDLRLIRPGFGSFLIAANVSISQNAYLWNVGNVTPDVITYSSLVPVSDGQYAVQICERGSTVCDASDSTFVITSGGIY